MSNNEVILAEHHLYTACSERHWGSNGEDSCEVSKDGTVVTRGIDGSTISHCQDGSVTATWPDGTIFQENTNGTGYVGKADGSRHHWGPKNDDNYDVTADGGIQRTDSNGNVTTVWPFGVMRFDNIDGTGMIWTPRTEGTYQVHHWGPDPTDSYVEISGQAA